MAACELTGELKYRDGQTHRFTVKVDNGLKSTISGIKRLNADIAEVLTALVDQEKSSTEDSRADSDDDGEEESDEEDGTTETASKSNPEPPKKRIKT